MSEQAVDLRSVWAVLRRRSSVLIAVTALGALAGVGLLVVSPPAYTSTSIVLLPSAAQPGSGRTGTYDAETQVLIVKSSEILSRAARQVRPRLTETEVGDRVTVEAPTSAILHITAAGPTARQAEELALAVAQSLVSYLEETRGTLSAARRAQLQERLDTLNASLAAVTSEIRKATDRIAAEGKPTAAGLADAAALSDLTAVRATTVLDIDSLKKQIAGGDETSGSDATSSASASVIQPASPGTQHDYVTDAAMHVLGGAALLFLVTSLFLVATNQRDPKLRSRDEIADAVDIPVVASLRVRPARSAGAWADLLRRYAPDSVDGWALRRLFHGLMPDTGKEGASGEPLVLVVLALSGDTAGLAIAPQVASFAASTGIPTQLVAAQHHESATTLWAACSHGWAQEDLPPALSVGTVPDTTAPVALSVRLVVLDRGSPQPDAAIVRGGTGILAVSSASATRRNLADAVVAADQVGLTVQGIVVANPDPLDRTTGRLAPVERHPSPVPLPADITGRAQAGPTTAGAQRGREGQGGAR